MPAKYYERNGSRYLMYEEQQEKEMTSKNHLRWQGGRVELTRKGSIGTYMVFEKGLRHATEYRTPYGSLLMDVCTENVVVQEKEDRIDICVIYQLEMGGESLSDCRIDMCIRAR